MVLHDRRRFLGLAGGAGLGGIVAANVGCDTVTGLLIQGGMKLFENPNVHGRHDPPSPDIPAYRVTLEELAPYFAAYLWVDEQAIDDDRITRVNVCRGNNGLEYLAERDPMKGSTAFTLLAGALPALNSLVIEYAKQASQAHCPPRDSDCLRDAFHDILDDGRFRDMICSAEQAHNAYVDRLIADGVHGTKPRADILQSIRIARIQAQLGLTPEKPAGAFYLDVCE